MALFFEWGEGKGLVLHRRTTPGPLQRVWLKLSVIGGHSRGSLLGVGGGEGACSPS